MAIPTAKMSPIEESTKTPPTVPGAPLIGNTLNFMGADGMPVEFFQQSQQLYGDVVQLKAGGKTFYLISDIELIHEILVKRSREFQKPEALFEKPGGLSRFLGKGVLTAGHDEWKPQRKLMQPFMHRKHIENYAETMGEMGNTLLAEWEDGTVRNIHSDMANVTMWIISKTMFGLNEDQLGNFERTVAEAQQIVVDDIISVVPAWVTQRDARAAKLNNSLTDFVNYMQDEYQKDDSQDRYDLLSLLLETRDEDGNPLSDEFIRNNILTMFLAGHETTANTLTWAFYYLSQNPEVLKQLQAEVDSVLVDGRAPTLEDLKQLPYTMMVIKETMRIQPTVSIIPRGITEDVELGGYMLESGSAIFMSPYVLHNDPRYWETPDVFDPMRFSEENEPNITKYAYLPFGGGPRVCIGNHFALMEAQVILAQIVRQYELHLIDGAKIDPIRHVTTYPKNGLPMRLERRG